MKYQNKKNGKVATLISTNEKYKTVTLEFEGGTVQDTTISTFKRWWKKVDFNDVVDVVEEVEEPIVEEVSTAVEIVEEVSESVPEKSEDKKVISTESFENLMSMLSSISCITESREWVKNSVAIKVSGKPYMEIRATKKRGYTLYMKESVAKERNLTYTVIRNYYLPACIKGVDNIETIKSLFKEEN